MDSDKPKIFIPNRFKEHVISDNESDKYLFSNSRNDFVVYSIETWLQHLTPPIYPHRKSVTSFLFLSSGTAVKSCGLDTYNMQQKSICVVPQGYLTSTMEIAPEATGFYCHFDFSIFPIWRIQNLKRMFPFLFTDEHPYLILDEVSSQALNFLLQRLELEYRNNRETLNFDLISSYLVCAFQEMKLFYPDEQAEKSTRNAQITSEFKELLYNEIKGTKSAAEFAEKLNVSPNHLNKSVKTTTGKTAKELINEALILEAKNLLFETDLSIAEVALELGLEDASYFSRLFKQHSGETPQSFRKMIEKSK